MKHILLAGVLLFTGQALWAANVTLNSCADAEVDSSFDYCDVPLGVASDVVTHGEQTELRIERYDPNFYPGYTYSHALIKWDLSSIGSGQRITSVTLEMSSWYAFYGQVAVYGIAAGNWDEATVTWNSWAATPQTLVFIGLLSPAGNVEQYGRTVYSDPNLTAWVQKWVNGTQANYGLILKMPDNSPCYGTSFSSKEDTYVPPSGLHLYYAPQLKISYELATTTVTGKAAFAGFTGDTSMVGVQLDFKQGATVVSTQVAMLDSAGNFSVSGVPLGTYDVVVKICSQLQKVKHSVSLTTTDPVSLGTLTFKGGDFNGDGVVDSKDLSYFAHNWLAN